jgi:hypothetical protein
MFLNNIKKLVIAVFPAAGLTWRLGGNSKVTLLLVFVKCHGNLVVGTTIENDSLRLQSLVPDDNSAGTLGNWM